MSSYNISSLVTSYLFIFTSKSTFWFFLFTKTNNKTLKILHLKQWQWKFLFCPWISFVTWQMHLAMVIENDVFCFFNAYNMIEIAKNLPKLIFLHFLLEPIRNKKLHRVLITLNRYYLLNKKIIQTIIFNIVLWIQ